jgi:hypothetical protein
LIYRFSAIPARILAGFFAEIDPEIHMKNQGAQNSQNNLEK